MRRTRQRNGEPLESRARASTNFKSRVMFNLSKLARPKLGLFVGLCLCLATAVMIFAMSSYYKDTLTVKDGSFDEKVPLETEEERRAGDYDVHAARPTVHPVIRHGRFKDIPNKDDAVEGHENPTTQKSTTGFRNEKEYDNMVEELTIKYPSKDESDSKIDTHGNEGYYVLLQLVNAEDGSKFASNFHNCIKSILKRTKLDLKFLLTVDETSKVTAEKIFRGVTSDLKLATIPPRTYFLIDELNTRVYPYTKALQELFSSGQGAYYSHAIFFIAPVLHKILPKAISRLVMLDTDLQFRTDIKELFSLFDKMQSHNIMALATDQQPVYRHVLWSYRQKNPGTKVGEPPPDGKTGFNSGVKLVNLEEMRNSQIYNELLQKENSSKLAKKYEFKGHLGDQDFYSLISFDHPGLFYTLPCQWNRQLCTWWKNNGYQNVFDLYFKCSPPFYVIHGNCNTPIPDG